MCSVKNRRSKLYLESVFCKTKTDIFVHHIIRFCTQMSVSAKTAALSIIIILIGKELSCN